MKAFGGVSELDVFESNRTLNCANVRGFRVVFLGRQMQYLFATVHDREEPAKEADGVGCLLEMLIGHGEADQKSGDFLQ